ncbi:MAG: ATP phosphoribosyltransferase [Clostridia bacterium]|nr:ATP phosphoribosyltransferase [Clostridia bacterium]
MLNIALPKGRLGESVLKRFKEAGYVFPELEDGDRRLVIPSENGNASFFLVKPTDVPVYVEYGVADVGVAGKDVLIESGADVYELIDLGLGKCRLAVAAKNDFRDDQDRLLRVATKYPNVSKAYFSGLNRDIEIVTLNGSIELAPILGLTDVIVDIVETGKTLKENGLSVINDVVNISARLIANKAASKFKQAEVSALVKALGEVIK